MVLIKSNSLKVNERGKALRRRSRRMRLDKRSQFMHFVETITFKLGLGSSTHLTVGQLKNRPYSSNFRIQYVHISATTANDGKGNYVPSAIQLSMQDTEFRPGTGHVQATTGPVLLGAQPRNVKIHNTRQAEWLPYNCPDNMQFCTVSSICLGRGEESAFIHGTIHVLVRFGAEVFPSACPPDYS